MSVKSQHLLSNVPQPDVVESAADDEKESENFVDYLINDEICYKCEEVLSNSDDGGDKDDADDVVECAGNCQRRFHRKCIAEFITDDKNVYRCKVCDLGGKWCFLCKKPISNDVAHETCELNQCKNSFHASCITNLNEKSNRRFVCSHHYCATCASEGKTCTKGPFLCCIRCPTAYHKSDRCIPAGTFLLNYRWVVCTEHSTGAGSGANRKLKLNVNFCFACGLGGILLCCETCPCALHLECAGLKTPPEGCFYCTACEKNKKPLYGDIVWAKFGSHRWWPAQIVHPLKVPTNLEKRLNEPGIFLVQFYGTRDYAPVTRRSVFPFEADDHNEKNKAKAKDKRFLSALTEARQALQDRNFAQLNDAPTYLPIKTNKYHPNVSPAYVNHSEKNFVCGCNKNDANPCGDDLCENRSTFCECNSKYCLAEENCQNQRFTKRQYAPTVKFLTIDRGFGLRTLQPLKKGDFVIEYCGEVVNQEECNRRLAETNTDPSRAFYFLELAHDKIIDAGPMGNDARFINHACDANCDTDRWVVNGEYRIGLFANRHIEAGEELTFHYNLDTLGFNFKTPCKCGLPKCTGLIGRKYKTSNNRSNGFQDLPSSAKRAKLSQDDQQ